jgi:hypothetical protein
VKEPYQGDGFWRMEKKENSRCGGITVAIEMTDSPSVSTKVRIVDHIV